MFPCLSIFPKFILRKIFKQQVNEQTEGGGGGGTSRQTLHALPVGCGVGSSDFPRSLCFMWYWFGLEILRLVYKKSVIWAFNFQKNSTVPYKSWKIISSKLVMQGIKRSELLCWFQKYVKLLRQEVPKDFFSEKQFFAKFSKSLKIQFFCTFLKSAQNSASFDTLHTQFRRNFFSTLIRGGAIFFEG